MITSPNVRCVVVVAEGTNGEAEPTTRRFRPSDLLPWADPHIRSLVEQLQEEVRAEQRARASADAPRASALMN